MKLFVIGVLAATLAPASAGEQPIVRAQLQPGKGTGQPVRRVVTVLVPNYFTGGSDFPEI
jgi:hypothetical protein